LGFSTGTPRPVSLANLDAIGLAAAGAEGSFAAGGGVDDLAGTVAGVSLGVSFGASDCSEDGTVSSDGLGSSFLVSNGLEAIAGVGPGDESFIVSIFLGSTASSLRGDSGLRRPTGLSWTSLMGDVRPDPVGSPNGLPLPRSTLLRCCLMRLISVIQAGCAGGACFALGDSGLLSALSNQLDFVGLHRLEGLGGDVSSCGRSFSLNVE
jgi:hypothetical protein